MPDQRAFITVELVFLEAASFGRSREEALQVWTKAEAAGDLGLSLNDFAAKYFGIKTLYKRCSMCGNPL
jgi:hypothetical protein